MIDQRRLVRDAQLLTLYEMRKIVVLFEPLARLGEDGVQLLPQLAILDVFDFARELDPVVPSLQRRLLGERAYSGAIRLDGMGGGCPCPPRRKISGERRHGDARGQALDVNGEVNRRQRFIKIVDVKKDVFLRGGEGPEVHQMAIAAGLHGNPRACLVPEVLRHHRGGTAQKGERTYKHPLIANRYKFGHAVTVAGGQDGHRITFVGTEQLGMFLAASPLPQADPLIVTFGKRARWRLRHCDLSRKPRWSGCRGADCPDAHCITVGRIKDMDIRGGENLYPREIEEFLFRHPKVEAVQVVGVPDPRYGEELCAWIKLKSGTAAMPAEIQEFCKDQIAHYKIPRYIKFVDAFPMTVTGKVQKFIIREQLTKELGLAEQKTA